MAAEVSAQQAADILDSTRKTVWVEVRSGRLPARRQGVRGLIRIDLDKLRQFAIENGYRFNEALAEESAKE